jgi:hypothetical protein
LVTVRVDVPLAKLGHPQRHNVARIERIEINSYKVIYFVSIFPSLLDYSLPLKSLQLSLGGQLTEHYGNVYREENCIQQVTLTRED